MITAVDTNVLVDVFGKDPKYFDQSAAAIQRCRVEGVLVACAAVWAELIAGFKSANLAAAQLEALGVSMSVTGAPAATAAGEAWRRHREACGSRSRLAADFLIGAHALVQADRLLTRDRGFYRTYFKKLDVLDPTAPSKSR